MNANLSSWRSIAGMKRRTSESMFPAKRLRSKIPRRKRVPLLPIIVGFSSNSEFDGNIEEDTSSSCLKSEISVESTFNFTGSEVKRRPRSTRASKSKKFSSGDEFRRITRSYAKKMETLRSGRNLEGNDESSEAIGKISKISESSRLDSVSLVTDGFSARNLKESDVSSKNYEKFQEISESSCVDSVAEAKLTRISNSIMNEGSSFRVAAENKEADLDSDNDVTLPEIELELSCEISERDSSEYSFSDTDENFSERSSENSAPSATFSLFLQLAKQFVKLSSKEKSRNIQNDSSLVFEMFEEEEVEESYKFLRVKERSGVILHDLDNEYRSTIDCGDQVFRQRLLMVNWMVEHSMAMELHQGTLILGVNLMDRFLSKGCFENERNLQLLGIASLTLATRLEEVQPWNSIRCRSFKVENNVYSRHEVVAMEWLVLDVLNFKCMIPTTHNFLWFYLKAAKADAEVENLTRYLAVLSLLDHEMLHFWPSTTAAGLVILACLATNRDSSCLRVMEKHVRTRSDDLPECIQSLEWLVKYAS